MFRHTTRAILMASLSVFVVSVLCGCAAMRNRFGGGDEYIDEYGDYGEYGDGACGPDGCSTESIGSGFSAASGSDVFGGSMSSPARGSSFGGGSFGTR